MLRKNKATPQIDNAVAKAVNFEVSIADIARRSEKRAWMVAITSLIMSLILAGGYFYMLPLKEKVPYLVMADAYTGVSTVAKLRGDFSENFIYQSEALAKSNIAHYIIARESYDAQMFRIRDWKIVHSMSTPEIGAAYADFNNPSHDDSPFKVYGTETALRVEILAITPLQEGTPQRPRYTASVRYQVSKYDNKSGKTMSILFNMLANLEYVYNSALEMSDSERVDNPLGFQVVSYRVDNDASGSQPVAPPTAPVQTQQYQGQTAYPPQGQPGYTPAQQGQAGYPPVEQGQAPTGQVPTGQAGYPPQPAQGQQPQGRIPPAPEFPAPGNGAVQQPAQPQFQNQALPAGQPQPVAPSGQAPNKVNGVRN